MKWVMPVTWEMCAYINVDAATLKEAMEIARDEAGIIPLPESGAQYVDGSWNLSIEDEGDILLLQTEEVAAAHEKQRRIRDDC